MDSPLSKNQIALEAAEWVLRLDEDAGEDMHAAFVAWLKLSPRHVDEFLLVEAAYRSMHGADSTRRLNVDTWIGDAKAQVLAHPIAAAVATHTLLSAPPIRQWAMGVAAAAAVTGISLLTWKFVGPSTIQAKTYATQTGEQQTFKLADGSLLSLNTQSQVRIDFSGSSRNIQLVRGEALFSVKPDAQRPFRVHAGATVIRAIGTTFNVYRKSGDDIVVSVLEGRVQIAGEQPLAMGTGEEADVSAAGKIARRRAPDVSQTLAWRQRRLVFRETPLVEVAEQFNRYNGELRLQVEGEAMARRKITGTFNADEPQSLVNFLAHDRAVTLEERGGTVVIGLK